MNLEYYISYLWGYITTYALHLINVFADYPLVIQICSIGVTLFALAALVVFFMLIKLYRKRHKEYKIINNLDSKYREPLRNIILEKDNLSVYEVARLMKYNRSEPFTKREFRWFTRLLRDVRLECEDKANENNVNSIMRAIDFDTYAAYTLKHASLDGKMRLTRSLRFLGNHIKMDEAIAKLRKSEVVVLRKTALFTYAWNNPNEALKYFDSKEFETYCCLYDMMIFHDIMKRNASRGYSFPDLLNWINIPERKKSKALFVREMRYLGISDKCEALIQIYKESKDAIMNKEIVTNWGFFKYQDAEQLMIDTYSYQEEVVQCAILEAIRNIMSGKASEFLYSAYMDATDYNVKIESIKSLFAYYRHGNLNIDIEQIAKPGDENLFKYFKEIEQDK